jgi:hypothetical protein
MVLPSRALRIVPKGETLNQTNSSAIHFQTPLTPLGPDEPGPPGMLISLPQDASAKLPSRGMAMVEGALNGLRFRAPLESDGNGGHWFKIDMNFCDSASLKADQIVSLEIEPLKVWPEPEIPEDLKQALAADFKANAVWSATTTLARWDWIRWLESVKQVETRQVRPAKMCSMLSSGKRRPCCFDRSLRMPPRRAEPL